MTDEMMIKFKVDCQQMIVNIESQRDYHRDVDGTTNDDEQFYDESIAKYQKIIDAINEALAPMGAE
jgi:hypothetical protein